MKKFLATLSIATAFCFAVGNAQAQDANFDILCIQCNNGKYLSSNAGNGAMTCDRDSVGSWEIFRVVIVSDGFILQTNPLDTRGIVRVSGSQSVLTNRGNTNDGRTTFSWGFPSSDTSVRTISRNANGKFWNSRNGESPLTVTSDNASRWETFTIRQVN